MSSDRRAERRRAERARQKQPVIIAGDGVVARSLDGSHYEARPHAHLPAKQPGEHRWVATAAWVATVDMVEGAEDVDRLKFLDNENLMHLSLGCWDCEQPLGAIKPGSRCPAPAVPS